jgi:hypothetical protein
MSVPISSPQKKVNFENLARDYLKIWDNIYTELKRRNSKALIYGSIALYYRLMNSRDSIELLKLGRNNGPQDLNVLVPTKYRDIFKEVVINEGFTPYYHLEVTIGDKAGIFFMNEMVIKAYYMDKISFNHDFEVDWSQEYSLSLTDLLLTKLQIHYALDKDIADIIAILLKYDEIDKEKIARVLSSDWGFWKDAVSNLNKIRELIKKIEANNPNTKLRDVIPLSLKFIGYINNYPKSDNWKPLGDDEKYWKDF